MTRGRDESHAATRKRTRSPSRTNPPSIGCRRAARLLVDDGTSKPQLTGRRRQHQIAGVVETHLTRAVEGQDDGRGSAPGATTKSYSICRSLP